MYRKDDKIRSLFFQGSDPVHDLVLIQFIEHRTVNTDLEVISQGNDNRGIPLYIGYPGFIQRIQSRLVTICAVILSMIIGKAYRLHAALRQNIDIIRWAAEIKFLVGYRISIVNKRTFQIDKR